MDSTALSSVWDNYRKKSLSTIIGVCSLALAIKDKEKELGWQYVFFFYCLRYVLILMQSFPVLDVGFGN